MLENRLHFRLHAALQTLKSKMAGDEQVGLNEGDDEIDEIDSPQLADGDHSGTGLLNPDQSMLGRSISADEGLGQTAAERSDLLTDDSSDGQLVDAVGVKTAAPEVDICSEGVGKLSIDSAATANGAKASVNKPNSKMDASNDVTDRVRDCNSNDVSL